VCVCWKYELHVCFGDAVVCVRASVMRYGVATISSLLKITGLFCRISSLL